jgi:hypothetical protein
MPNCFAKGAVTQITNKEVIPMRELFLNNCLTEQGMNLLCGICKKVDNCDIFIECMTDKTDGCGTSWESANVHAYEIAMFFIKNGIKPDRITYIGYGNISANGGRANVVIINLSKKNR